MRILYVAMKHDYGRPERGLSFEHYNFFSSLHHTGHDILYFDFMSLLQTHGRSGMSRRLVEVVDSERPDLLFSCLFTDQFERDSIRAISQRGRTVTLNWFCDDHWRFESFSRHWAPCFHWVVTTARSAVPKYQAIGYPNTLKSQWGCNHFIYRDLGLAPSYDVTFVGQPHGSRRAVVDEIRRAGIDVRTWGMGWESGRIDHEEMIRVFNQSRINLNLANASVTEAPRGGRLDRLRRLLSRGVRLVDPDSGRRVPSALEQIKGRNFEIPGCGGFVLSGHADDLETYYALEKEVTVSRTTEELIAKLRYYLDQDDERAVIARAGYERTIREHTYAHRFHEIFTRIGLPCGPLSLEPSPGQVEEVV